MYSFWARQPSSLVTKQLLEQGNHLYYSQSERAALRPPKQRETNKKMGQRSRIKLWDRSSNPHPGVYSKYWFNLGRGSH